MEIYNPHNYQAFAEQHILINEKAGLFLEMGLGKTVICLTAVDKLLMAGAVEKVLVIGPLRVAQSVWSQEAAKWEHTRHLSFSKILGTAQQRIAAIKQPADIWLINRENVSWLVGFLGGAWPWDLVIIDESSSFKSPDAARFKDLRMVLGKIKRMIALTGSPAGNGLIDLWAQIYLLDQGKRLGDTIGGYRSRYFRPDKMTGYVVHSYEIRKDSEGAIYDKISDLVISMKNIDYLELPERIDTIIPVIFDKALQKKYDEFEKELVLNIAEDIDVTAFNAGALTTKLLQFANGAVYDSEKNVHLIHDQKLDALEEIIDSAGGKPVLVFYSFQSDLARIEKRFKHARQFKKDQDILDWNDKKIQLAATHPASAGHGLNLQQGSNIIVWYGLTWSLELYQQANARLHRQGQKEKVYIYHIVSEQTMDQDVMRAIAKKAAGQDALMEAVKARIEKYKKESYDYSK